MWAAGSTSPTTLKTASSSRALRISWSFSRSRWRTRPSMVFVATKLKIRQSLLLAVAVDAAHALLQPVRVPGNVVVEQDVAELEVDALAGRLGGHEDLDVASLNCCSA